MKRIGLVVSMLVAAGGCERAADHLKAMHGGGPQAAGGEQQASQSGTTIDLQGGRMDCRHPMVAGFYEISREAFAAGPEKLDLEAYKQKTFAFMRKAVLDGGGSEKDADGWIGHVSDIPRQMIGIVKDDPDVLGSCEAFAIAMGGPP